MNKSINGKKLTGELPENTMRGKESSHSLFTEIFADLRYLLSAFRFRFFKKYATMKSSISHLLYDKQMDLRLIINVIIQKLKPEMVILYCNSGINPEFENGFFLLVITENDIPESSAKWEKTEKAVGKISESTSSCLVQQNIYSFNEEVADGNYFFGNILNEGIMLYDSGRFYLAKSKVFNAAENRIKAQDIFDSWFKSANEFLISFQFNFEIASYKLAIFELHQAVERYYTCTLLVHTGFRPKTHNLNKLRLMCSFFSKEIYNAFPRNSAKEKDLFELLKKAYIDARYKNNYSIAKEQLGELAFFTYKLKNLTEIICMMKIASF